MKIDENRLLDLEYLNSYIRQIEIEIEKIKEGYLDSYSLETFDNMSEEEIKNIFEGYDLKCLNLVQYFKNDYIDVNWEFADLFEDDISYSGELREELKKKALHEVEFLNKKIAEINENATKEIYELEGKTVLAKTIINILGDSSFTEKQINDLYTLLINASVSHEVLYNFSYNLTKKLIDKKKKQMVIRVEDTASFESKLATVYENTDYFKTSEENAPVSTYNETILQTYNEYRHLFTEVGLGDTLSEVLRLSYELSNGGNLELKSISKDSFCIELGMVLYKLNELYKKEKVDQRALGDLLAQLNSLDRMYDEDKSLKEYKTKKLKDINDSISIIKSLNVECLLADKVNNRLRLLDVELRNNFLLNERKNEISMIYKEIQMDMKNLPELSKQIKKLLKLLDKIDSKIKSNYADSRNFVDGNYEELSKYRNKVADILLDIQTNDYSANNNDIINELYSGYTLFNNDSKRDGRDILLKGFVLFDFDNNNVPYVVSDLDPNNMRNFIDNSIEKRKLVNAYNDYSKLIKDLLLIGEPELISVNAKAASLILDKVFTDKDRNTATNMVRIRPTRNSQVRFMSEKVCLRPGMAIFEQVIQLIEEILPNVKIDRFKDFNLYINYCSAIKWMAEDSYHAAINRYYKNSLLQRMFKSLNEESKLSDGEYKLLRDIINMTLSSYSVLEQKNPNIKCNIVDSMKGGRTRG